MHLCGIQAGSDLGQLALRRPLPAPDYASGCLELLPASAGRPYRPYFPRSRARSKVGRAAARPRSGSARGGWRQTAAAYHAGRRRRLAQIAAAHSRRRRPRRRSPGARGACAESSPRAPPPRRRFAMKICRRKTRQLRRHRRRRRRTRASWRARRHAGHADRARCEHGVSRSADRWVRPRFEWRSVTIAAATAVPLASSSSQLSSPRWKASRCSANQASFAVSPGRSCCLSVQLSLKATYRSSTAASSSCSAHSAQCTWV